MLLQTVIAGNIYASVQGEARIDSLLKELPHQKEDTNKAKLFCALSIAYIKTNPEKCLKYGGKSLELSTKIGWEMGIGLANQRIGEGYYWNTNYSSALEYYFTALNVFKKIGDKFYVADAFEKIGLTFSTLGETKNALEFNLKALKLWTELANKQHIASVSLETGNNYYAAKNNSKAFEYLSKAVKIAREIGNETIELSAINSIGEIYYGEKKYTVALDNYIISLQKADQAESDWGRAWNYCDIGRCFLSICQDSSPVSAELKNYYKTKLNIDVHYAATPTILDYAKYCLELGLELSKKSNSILSLQICESKLVEAYKLSGDYQTAMVYLESYCKTKDSIFSKEVSSKILKLSMETQYRENRYNDSLATLQKDLLISIELRRQKKYTIASVFGIFLLSFFTYFIFRERSKSDRLLHNILPAEVAKELKKHGTSEAKDHDSVTVLFTDFVNFTNAGEKMSAKGLVDELHNCFTKFDEITHKYGIEKIKTIGDAYLAVAGLPTPDPNHAENVVRAAIEISAFVQDRVEKMGTELTFDIRIGIHSGGVVAGIVGIKKFAYDIWGDTVNTAARMEQNCEAGKINISETTYELVKDNFSCNYRGEISAKGKGLLKMYYVG